jgi:hypothetical protein
LVDQVALPLEQHVQGSIGVSVAAGLAMG